MSKNAFVRAMIAAACIFELTACGGASSPAGNAAAPAPAAMTKSAGKLDITLDSISVGHSVGPAGLVPAPGPGATYVLARYTIKNNAAEPLPAENRPEPRLVDPAGHRFSQETFSSTAISAAEDPNGFEAINPNVTRPATSVWKVDEKSFDAKTWKIAFPGKHPLTFDLQ